MAGLYLNHVKVAEESGGIVSLPNTVQFNNLKIGGTEVINSNRQIQNITGIDFSPSSGTGTPSSNLLDDYEEGTFIPVLTGSTSGTFDGRGFYTKIGNVVHIEIEFGPLSAAAKPIGNYIVTGLPFASQNRNPTAYTMFNIGGFYSVTFDSSKIPGTYILDNTNYITLAELVSNGGATLITDSNFVSAGNHYFRINGNYHSN